jgi:pimeloyl-ACP methyl ester carboxylesterase
LNRIFLPGYLGRARSYEPGLPPGWLALQAPAAIRATGSVERYAEWMIEEVRARGGKAVLGGHSMGAGVALLAAARAPELVEGLVLVAPSGLPISKPGWRIVRDFLRHVAAGRYRASDVLAPLGDLARHPQAGLRLARTLRRIDLSDEMRAVRETGIRSTVIGCRTDTLTPPTLTRRIAELLGADYRELDLDGGHVWMFGSWHLLAAELRRAMVALPNDTGGGSP